MCECLYAWIKFICICKSFTSIYAFITNIRCIGMDFILVCTCISYIYIEHQIVFLCGSVVEHCLSCAKGCGFNSQGTNVLMKMYNLNAIVSHFG